MQYKRYTVISLIKENLRNPVAFAFAIVFAGLTCLLQVLQFIFMGNLTNVMSADNFVISTAFVPLVLVIGANLGSHVIRCCGLYLDAQSIPNLMHGIRRRLLRDTLSRDVTMFTNELSGAISNRMGQIDMAIRNMLRTLQWSLLAVFIEIFVTVYYAFSVNKTIGGLSLLWVLSALVFSYLFVTKKMYRNVKKIASARSESNGYRTDLVSNIAIVLTTDWFKNGTQYFDEKSQKLRDEIQRNVILYNVLFGSLMFIEVLFLAFIIYISASLVGTGDVNIGQFVASTFLLFRLSKNIWAGSLDLKDFLESYATVQDAIAFLEKYKKEDLSHGEQLELDHPPSLEFKDIKFTYKTSTVPLFDGFNLNIKSGEKVALVGHSGAGKTSVVSLALGFYQPDEGALLVDDKPASFYSKNSYRNHMSVISQDTSLFHQSIRDNIGYGMPYATEEDIINAAKKAHAHEFITKLEKGYDSMVGDRGVQLSGGQRQRIAIARAILKNAPIFILDEATSALDSQSERYIQQSLHDVMQNKTVIAIAHRLSTISEMDRIVVMDAGRIVEEGPHENLLKKGGVYAKMWAMQSGGFLPEE